MTHCPVYSPGEGMRIEVPITKDSLIKSVLMGDNYISLAFNHTDILPINRGWYIVYKGRKWAIMDEVIPESHSKASGYVYELKFYAQQHQMKRSRVFWVQDGIKEAAFNLTTTLSTFAELICSNMNAFLEVDYWRVGNIPEELSTKTLALSFDGVTCWDAVADIAELFETEWWVDDDASPESVTLNFGKCLHGDEERFAEGEVISKMPISKVGDNAEYGNRFYVFGGTRNIPQDYRHTDQGGITNHVSERRLRLPIGTDYVDAWDGLAQSDIVEQVVFLDNIYPKNEELITYVQTRNIISEGINTTIYRIYCAGTSFKPSDIIDNESLGATFLSGSLQGREFELKPIGESDITFDKGFEIIVQREDAGGDSEVYIPNYFLHPVIGDRFILTGVKLPEASIRAAELTLLLKAQDIAHQRSKDTNNYDCTTNAVYCHTHDKEYEIGQRVRLIGTGFGNDGRESRVVGFEKKLYDGYQATYTIGENIRKSKLSALMSDVKVAINKPRIDLIGTKVEFDRQQFYTVENKLKIEEVGEDLETFRTDTGKAEEELRATIFAADQKAEQANAGLEAQKEEAFLISKQVGILIDEDKNKSVRDIATDVVLSSMPTEVATAKQKLVISTSPIGGIYQANIVYEWASSPTEININGLSAANEQYDNEWIIRFGSSSVTKMTITPTVLWVNGEQPTFSSWGICELRFIRVSGMDAYIGEWKVYK